MVGNVKSLVDRLSKDFSASRPPLAVHDSRKPVVSKPSQPPQHVITAFAYSAVQDDELTLELGDVIEVLEEVEDGWSRGRQLRTNLIGMFPTNFVKPDVPPSSTPVREDDKVVVRRPADPDQPEANRRTPSAVGGVNIFGAKTVHSEPKDEVKTKEMARVKFEYEPQHSDELKLAEVGQLVTIIRKDCGDAGWFEGEINGRRGLFPDNFVELVQVPMNTQSGTIYHPPPTHHSKIITKTPMMNPPGMVPPAVPAKPLKQKLSESSTSLNGAGASPPSSTTNVPCSPPVLPSQVKQQNSAFAAARNRISKDLVVGQPGQVSSKLTKSVIVSSGSESVATSRPMSSVETDEASDEVIRPLSHVTKTRARPPGKRPASMLLIKKKGSMDNLLESPSKPMASELPEKSPFSNAIGAPLPSPVSAFSTINREVHAVSPAPITPPVKVVPLRPPAPAEHKLEEKKEHIPVIKPSVPPPAVTHFPTTFPTSSSVDSEWVSRKEYNELLARLASMEARIAQLEKR
ncbi:SH3 domain protein [Cooperia oncophora]